MIKPEILLATYWGGSVRLLVTAWPVIYVRFRYMTPSQVIASRMTYMFKDFVEAVGTSNIVVDPRLPDFCQRCGYHEQKKLNTHLRDKHNQRGLYRCVADADCNRFWTCFVHYASYLNHMEQHEDAVPMPQIPSTSVPRRPNRNYRQHGDFNRNRLIFIDEDGNLIENPPNHWAIQQQN